MAKKPVHIVPRDNGWAVRREGAQRDSSHHDTKADADKVGRRTAQRDHTELVTHGKDGKIQDKDSFGNDPFPPRDTKH
ncbi:MAG: DUF2188 domain-containing protein [Acidobacteria bacterium]|nr:DUF2188 domain-containing protein [Acidobacteriota bacterium]